jgi:hypothetical protein
MKLAMLVLTILILSGCVGKDYLPAHVNIRVAQGIAYTECIKEKDLSITCRISDDGYINLEVASKMYMARPKGELQLVYSCDDIDYVYI